MPSTGPALQIEVLVTRPEDPAQDRIEGARLDRHTELGGDRFGRDVRLLSGDAALLDGEAGGVADRVDPLALEGPAVVVDANEAV